MITEAQWNSLVYLTPRDFTAPGEMDFSIVQRVDQFAQKLGSRPQVISDYRPYDPNNPNSQHAKGRAMDTVWQVDPLVVWNAARESKLFSGLGIYLNDRNAVSFHFDTRTNRTVENPALWGDLITHIHDPSGAVARKDEYTAAGVVLSMIKKKGPEAIIFLIILGSLIHRIR